MLQEYIKEERIGLINSSHLNIFENYIFHNVTVINKNGIIKEDKLHSLFKAVEGYYPDNQEKTDMINSLFKVVEGYYPDNPEKAYSELANIDNMYIIQLLKSMALHNLLRSKKLSFNDLVEHPTIFKIDESFLQLINVYVTKEDFLSLLNKEPIDYISLIKKLMQEEKLDHKQVISIITSICKPNVHKFIVAEDIKEILTTNNSKMDKLTAEDYVTLFSQPVSAKAGDIFMVLLQFAESKLNSTHYKDLLKCKVIQDIPSLYEKILPKAYEALSADYGALLLLLERLLNENKHQLYIDTIISFKGHLTSENYKTFLIKLDEYPDKSFFYQLLDQVGPYAISRNDFLQVLDGNAFFANTTDKIAIVQRLMANNNKRLFDIAFKEIEDELDANEHKEIINYANSQEEDKAQEPVAKNVEKPVVENVEKPVVENVEKPVAEKVKEPVAENVEKPGVVKVEEPVAKIEELKAKFEEPGEGNIPPVVNTLPTINCGYLNYYFTTTIYNCIGIQPPHLKPTVYDSLKYEIAPLFIALAVAIPTNDPVMTFLATASIITLSTQVIITAYNAKLAEPSAAQQVEAEVGSRANNR